MRDNANGWSSVTSGNSTPTDFLYGQSSFTAVDPSGGRSTVDELGVDSLEAFSGDDEWLYLSDVNSGRVRMVPLD